MNSFMILILFLVGLASSAVAPGTGECSAYTQQIDCLNSGYCKWNGSSCVLYTSNQDCYRIDEIGACRANGKYESLCMPLDLLNIEYKNVCGITTTIDYNFVRYPIVTTGYPHFSISGLTLAQLKVAKPQINFLFQVLTVNIQIAPNKELQDILDLYKEYEVTFQNVTVHPYYLEKCLFQTLQNLRDDTQPLSSTDKQNTLTKFWSIVQVYQKKMAFYSKHYQTNYYFLNFAQTTFSRLYITIEGQDHTTSLTWVKYQRNGYIQAVSYTPKLFGINDALTDVVYINVIAEDGISFINIENMEIIYTQTTGTLTNISRQLKFISDKTQIPHTFSSSLTSTPCDEIERTCKFTLPSPLIDSQFIFYIQK
ncbi:unnamed protein product [Paramecium sonneborni]|uniref:Uncharacterized protein n=1 Tax=Paramecium sonneborni TaxID=65129 RepID=A0A8S1QWU3_9CILI|nr:unnamed protein product [Paramecium sonneborni]